MIADALLEVSRKAQARLEPYRELFEISDFIRARSRTAVRVRQLAVTLKDPAEMWEALKFAARAETEVLAIEAHVDDILADGPWT
jgi:hypothetical protein